MIVAGVDPGGRESGVVVRERDRLLAWRVLRRTTDGKLPDGGYLRKVVGYIVAQHRKHAVDVVAVETLAWWPKSPPRDERGLYGTAMTLGAVLLRFPDAEVVKPGGGHGGLHGLSYPAEIRPRGKGTGLRRHARSAYDVSHVGETQAKRKRLG